MSWPPLPCSPPSESRPANRPIGVVTVEHFARDRDPHELPEQLPNLLHFLQHAGGALDNVILRRAYLAIGQAVLDSKALGPTASRVLSTVAEAVGCDYAALYLVDDNRRGLELAAGVGLAGDPDWMALAHFPLSSGHPAVVALQEKSMLTVRGSEGSQDRGLAERFGLHQYVRHFLPLIAVSEELGALELGFMSGHGRTTDESKRTLAGFGDQVAIAVHNMQLLRRTDQALARKLAEIAVGREIQLSLLPKACPTVPGWDFAATYQAARAVGDDFYDFCDLPGSPKRLGLVIADVADKGVPAALFMALSRTIIRSAAFSGRDQAAALIRANQLILNDSQAELFLSAIYAVPLPSNIWFNNDIRNILIAITITNAESAQQDGHPMSSFTVTGLRLQSQPSLPCSRPSGMKSLRGGYLLDL